MFQACRSKFVIRVTLLHLLVWIAGSPLVMPNRAIRIPNRCGEAAHFWKPRSYTTEQDRQVLDLFDGLRVADVSDGMDQAGLADVGLVSAAIGPLWRDTKHFTTPRRRHRRDGAVCADEPAAARRQRNR